MQPIHIRFGGYQPSTSVHNKAADALGGELTAPWAPRCRSTLMVTSSPPAIRLPICWLWSKAGR